MELIMEVTYRQTLNLITRQWVIPKRKTGQTSWSKIKKIGSVTSPKFGYAGAIHRIKRVFDRKRNPDGSKKWRTELRTVYFPKPTPEKPKSTYAITYLRCTRTSYGFTRSM